MCKCFFFILGKYYFCSVFTIGNNLKFSNFQMFVKKKLSKYCIFEFKKLIFLKITQIIKNKIFRAFNVLSREKKLKCHDGFYNTFFTERFLRTFVLTIIKITLLLMSIRVCIIRFIKHLFVILSIYTFMKAILF